MCVNTIYTLKYFLSATVIFFFYYSLLLIALKHRSENLFILIVLLRCNLETAHHFSSFEMFVENKI